MIVSLQTAPDADIRSYVVLCSVVLCCVVLCCVVLCCVVSLQNVTRIN